jgi:hypothetical protein
MTRKKERATGETRMPAKEFKRNFVQVPPMPRPIPAPEVKRTDRK